MSSSRLAACPFCARHVRLDEGHCPFCEAALPASFALTPPPAVPRVRLSRAARYAVSMGALSLSAASAACGSTGITDGKADGGPTDAAQQAESIPHYGGPPPDAGLPAEASANDGASEAGDDGASQEASSQDGATDAAQDVGTQPIYGAPPPRGPGLP